MFEEAESPQIEIAPAPKVQEHIEPIRKSDLRALLDLHKKGDFFPTKAVTPEDITRRDIIEYAYSRQMAYCLDQAATKLQDFDFSGEPVEKLRQDMSDVVLDVDTIPDGVQFTPAQREAVEKGVNLLVDDLVTFRRDIATNGGEQYIRDHLGLLFNQLSDESYTVDAKTYPGTVLVRVHSKDDYVKVAPFDTKGVYIPILGEDLLKGRILVAKGVEPDVSTEYHEYLHFLNGKLQHIEVAPQKQKKAEEKVQELTHVYEVKLSQLKVLKEGFEEIKYEEMENTGRATEETLSKLTEVNNKIKQYEKSVASTRYFAHAEVFTYHDPEIASAFRRVKDELQSYMIGDNEIPKRFVDNTLTAVLADTLSKNTEGQLFLAELAALKEILTLASETDLSPREIGFLVSGARNLQQATKFVYLHLQQAPKRVREAMQQRIQNPSEPATLPLAA